MRQGFEIKQEVDKTKRPKHDNIIAPDTRVELNVLLNDGSLSLSLH